MQRFASIWVALLLCLQAYGAEILDENIYNQWAQTSLASSKPITERTLTAFVGHANSTMTEADEDASLPPNDENTVDDDDRLSRSITAAVSKKKRPPSRKNRSPSRKRPPPPRKRPSSWRKRPPPPRRKSPPPPRKKPPPPPKRSPPPPPTNNGERPRAASRSQMCRSRNLLSRGIVGGRRYGLKYYHACLNQVAKSMECCEQCRDAEGCQGWFFTRLDCSAFSSSPNAGVCYLLSDALLAYEHPGTWWNGGVQWTAEQTGWNLGSDWSGGSAVAMETGQQTDSFEMSY